MPLHYASGPPPVKARIRERPEDFQVEEELGFEPDGDGEHLLLRVRKRGLNTEEVAARLARWVGVRRSGVGYAGLKDRNAVTTQWFSIALSGRADPDWRTFTDERVEILEAGRHRRKLRRGGLRRNRFRLVMRSLDGDRAALEERLALVETRGVPNYFGEQRFGRDNLEKARALFEGRIRGDRHRRGLYLSAARSLLFNRVLDLRVSEGCWDRALSGEVLVLDGTRSFFHAGTPDAEVCLRVEAGDIHPSGPLWGEGDAPASDEALRLECRALEGYGAWCQGLEAHGMRHQRRALRVLPRAMAWNLDRAGGILELSFTLPAGSYATSVLREIAAYEA